MITLHESNITSFPLDNGIGVLSDAIRAYAEEELNGMFEFYMEYDSEGHLVDELKEERIIKAKAQDKLGYQLFRIYSITKNHENDNLIVNAQHITYDLANNFVEKMEANKLTKKQVMEKIGASTAIPHNFNVTSSNTTTISSTSLYRTNPLQMIAGMEGSVLQIWGGQIERDNFNFILHDRRGHDDGVTVTYEKNITGLEATFDISGLVTRIFPYVFIEATDDEPERLITVTGKYIDSPHINDYKVIRTEPIDYSSDERIDTQDKTDAQIRQQLTKVAKDYFKETGNDKIKVEMDVQFAHLWETEEYKDVKVLELVGMGDTVTINHSKLNVDATAIVNYIKYDCIAQVNEEVKLGSVKARLTDSINKIDSIEKKVEQAESHANQAIVSANGKNTTFYGPDEPVEGMQKGDLWFKVIDGQYHKTYRFDGIEWQLIIDMDNVEAKAEAQQARDRADESVERANQATQLANNAINQAQTSFDLAQESLTLGQGLTSRMTDAEGNLTALNQTTQSLAGQLSDVEGNITTLTATVDGLQTTVSDVQGNVSNLTQLSTTLQSRISDAEGNISTLTQTSKSMQSTISSLQDEWNNLEIGGRNFLLNTTTEPLTLDNPNSFDTVRINGITVSPNFFESAKGKEVTISIEARSTGYEKGTSPWIGVECVYYENDGTTRYLTVQLHSTLDTDGEWRRYSRTVSLPLDISSMRNSVTMLIRNIKGFVQTKQPKLEIGTVATDWSPAPEDLATQTQITQLSDAINLRVEKGDVLSQINIEAGRTLVQSNKLILDADTTVVTGDFKVGNANITSIDAGKVTVGDLVGHSLVSGKVIGGYIEQQSGNRRLEMYNGIIDSFYKGQLAMRFGQYSLEFYNRSGASVGRFGTTTLSDERFGLALTVENDYITIGHNKDGTIFPALRTQDIVGDRSTIVAGAYATSTLNQSTSLKLYANSRSALEGTRSTNQASILLSHTPNRTDVDVYYGSTTRSGSYTIRRNIDASSSRVMMEATESRVRFPVDVFFGSNNVRIETGNNYVRWHYDVNNFIRQYDTGRVDIVAGNNIRHSFLANGTKTGGTIEIDGKIWGMSPIDSPQVLIEYIEFDVQLSRFGTRIVLDEKYRKAVSNYAVFPSNPNVQVLEKGHDYFVVKGEGKSDFRIVGERIDATGAFWGDMNVDEVDINVA